MLIDSHTHLDHTRVDPTRLVADARAAGVGVMIQAGIDLESSCYSAQLAEQFPEVFAIVGYHPQEAGLLSDEGLAGIEELAAGPKVVAVGETGFDFRHDKWPHDQQERAFIRQIDLARRANLPVVVHTRDAADVTLSILADRAAGLIVILHCFSLPQRLDEIVERGYYISFAGNVTYKNAPDLQAAARDTPADHLLLETDAPWLAPMPFRGRPNRPALVAKVYEFVSQLRGLTVEALAAQIEPNAYRAFPRLAAARPAPAPGSQQ